MHARAKTLDIQRARGRRFGIQRCSRGDRRCPAARHRHSTRSAAAGVRDDARMAAGGQPGQQGQPPPGLRGAPGRPLQQRRRPAPRRARPRRGRFAHNARPCTRHAVHHSKLPIRTWPAKVRSCRCDTGVAAASVGYEFEGPNTPARVKEVPAGATSAQVHRMSRAASVGRPETPGGHRGARSQTNPTELAYRRWRASAPS